MTSSGSLMRRTNSHINLQTFRYQSAWRTSSLQKLEVHLDLASVICPQLCKSLADARRLSRHFARFRHTSLNCILSLYISSFIPHTSIQLAEHPTLIDAIMDEDIDGLLIFLLVMGIFISIPFIIILSIFSCMACSRTRKWNKEKARRALDGNTADLEAEEAALVDNDNDDEADSLDENSASESDSEPSTTAEAKAKAKAQREEDNKPDWHLTTGQKFRKELKKAFKGIDNKDAAKKKEKDERRKLAKAVAIEMTRVERRRARKANNLQAEAGEGSSAEDGLPSYNNATAAAVDDRKI